MRHPRSPAAVLLVLVLVAVVPSCGTSLPDTGGSTPPTTASTAASPPSSGVQPSGSAAGESCEYVPGGVASKPVDLPPTTGVRTSGAAAWVMKTNEGDVTLTMNRTKAPCTVNSFESLARQGFFDDTTCHRLTDSGSIFILQCGDPTGTSTGGPGYTFADETDGTESYTRGVVAMANAGPGTNSNGSQFFLIWQDSTGLDATPNYTIFATMDTESINVIARIAAEGQDGSNPAGGGTPNNPAEIISVKPR
ncbi:MAG: peptidylprolyl isomerase [Propionibacteriaceae bacterium]